MGSSLIIHHCIIYNLYKNYIYLYEIEKYYPNFNILKQCITSIIIIIFTINNINNQIYINEIMMNEKNM